MKTTLSKEIILNNNINSILKKLEDCQIPKDQKKINFAGKLIAQNIKNGVKIQKKIFYY